MIAARGISTGGYVYGLGVHGLGAAEADCLPAPDGVTTITITRTVGEPADWPRSESEGDRLIVPLIDGGELALDRGAGTAAYTLPREISDAELLHPWLVPAAAAMCAWHGRRVMHGGLVADGGKAVALVADREGGKSTLLSWLALRGGLDVMADDLVVLDGDTTFVGPRCIDLRRPSVDRLSVEEEATVVRDGTRWRLPLRPTAATATLAAVVVLEWSDELALLPVRGSERLPRLLPHALMSGLPVGRDGILGFANYPVYRLLRPRSWDLLPACGDLIRKALAH